MKDFNQVSIYRLNTILTLFQTENACYSIEELAKILSVPVSVIRKDIVLLYSNKECGITFFADDEYMDGEEFDDDFDEEDSFLDDLSAGRLDATPLMASMGYKNDVYLSLTSLELGCLDEFLDGEHYAKGEMHKNYVTKPLYNQARANMQVKVDELSKKIEKGKTVRLHYRSANGEILFLTIRPLELVHNAFDDLYYLVTIKEGRLMPLRLDRICKCEDSDENIEISDLTPLRQLPNIWGMEMGKPVHVKLLIRNEGNVWRKLRRDLAFRTNGKWTQDGDNLYFEDDVIGINNFRSWLNSYGSSVLVLEPQSLREEILESARKRLEYYAK